MGLHKSCLMAVCFIMPSLAGLIEQGEHIEALTSEPKYVDIKKNGTTVWLFEKHPRSLVNAWKTVTVMLDFGGVSGVNYGLMFGNNLTTLNEEMRNRRTWFWFLRNPDLLKSSTLDPFVDSYVGIDSSANYYVSLKINEFDTSMFGTFIFGLAMYLMARRLSEITITYYVCGAMSAILGSLLVLFIIIGKMMPRRPISLAFYWCGWSLTFYLWTYIKDNISSYYRCIVCYAIVVSLIAISWIYRWGTPIHFRTRQIFRCAIQLVGAMLVYLSCQIRELSIAILVALLVVSFTPVEPAMRLWEKWYTPRVRLLTMEEFEAQGRLETSRALEELRSFCNSPQCGQWNILSRLSDPHQFAMFMNGADHLSLVSDSDDEFRVPNGEPPLTSSRYSLLEDSDEEEFY